MDRILRSEAEREMGRKWEFAGAGERSKCERGDQMCLVVGRSGDKVRHVRPQSEWIQAEGATE
ncbi:MAG: hypothetical protein WC992_08805 [Acholeplasmataceae bacterium]